MLKLDITETAQADLVEIHEYIAADNPKVADSVADIIHDLCELLCEFPKLGKIFPKFKVPGLRRFPSGSYVVLYTHDEEFIHLIRVVHSARKVTRSFFRDWLS